MVEGGGVAGGFPTMKVLGGNSRLSSQYVRGQAERVKNRFPEDSGRFEEVTDEQPPSNQAQKGVYFYPLIKKRRACEC